ncbi:MAG: histidinol-phosphate transaminase [bacterium]
MKNLAQEHILKLQPYIPGKPISEVQRELALEEVIKLASNENPCGPSPKALLAIQQALSEIHRYPDGSGFCLKKAMGERLHVSTDQIIFGNGTNEILELVVRTFLAPGEEAVSAHPAFIIYSLLVQAAGGKNVQVPLKNHTHDLQAMADAITPKTKLVFIANPNNPTGTMVTGEDMNRFLQCVPKNVIVVFDEAYSEYVDDEGFPDSLACLRAFSDRPFLIARTFSKAYGLAGLRVGYGIGDPELIAMMNRVRQPFNVNSLALAAAEAALQDAEHLGRTREINRVGYRYLCTEFDRLKLSYIPSVANFILVNVGQDARAFSNRLLAEGVIVRPVGEYGLPTSVRITIGLEEENRKLIQAMEKMLNLP